MLDDNDGEQAPDDPQGEADSELHELGGTACRVCGFHCYARLVNDFHHLFVLGRSPWERRSKV